MAGELPLDPPTTTHSAPPALLLLPPIHNHHKLGGNNASRRKPGGCIKRGDVQEGWGGRQGAGGRDGVNKEGTGGGDQWWATRVSKRYGLKHPYINEIQKKNNNNNLSYSTTTTGNKEHHFQHYPHPHPNHSPHHQHHTPVVPIDRRSYSLYGFSAPKKPAFRVHKGFMANSLFFAVQTCRFNRVKVLIDQGLRPRVKDASGRNLLMACLEVEDQEKREKMFSYLLRRGADPHYVEPVKGQDVLTWAVCLGRAAQVRQLLDATVGDLNLQHKDAAGYTALHHAALGGHHDIARMLIAMMQRFHLAVDMYDRQGLTPYIHARRLGHHHISELLIKEGQASPRQADKHSFRGPDEWEAEGAEERRRKLREKRNQEHIRRKISGRFPAVAGADRDGGKHVPSIHVSGDSGRGSWDPSTGSSRTGITDGDSARGGGRGGVHLGADRGVVRPGGRDSLDVPDFAPAAGFPLNRKSSNRSLLGGAGTSKGSALNLMDDAAMLDSMTASHVTEFKSSEFDVNKQNEYKAIGIDVTQLMDSLSAQQSSAFRKTVIPPPVVPQKVIPVEAPKKEKVSTLAILMGKEKRKGGKTKRKTAGSEKKKKSERSEGKRKTRVTLPPIRAG